MLPVLRFFQHRTGSKTISHTADFDKLECMLHDPCGTPMCLPMDFLKAITRDFSEEQELGRGGYGVVYKGILRNGRAIAVKKLSQMHLEDAKFQNEVTYLIGLKHQNIVQLVGYCAESRWEATQVCGKYVMAEIRKRLLCFEYLNNKSLDRHLSAESCGLEWHMRYDIIRGICCGLHYLHTECHIIHLDLKPENILLDDNMVPKIADFGMSRLFGEQQSRKITESRGGTLGYMAPEYLTNGLISTKSDIFSLGVIIIEIITGSRDYPYSSEESFRHFIKNVVGNWMNRLEKTPKYIPLEVYSQQVNTCIMIALNCVDPDLQKRPAAFGIIQILNTVEVTNRTTSESEITTFSSSCTANISNSDMDFSTILNRASTSRTANISSAFNFSAKRSSTISMMGMLAFEVANVIVKGRTLMITLMTLSEEIKQVLRSEAICQLISEDQSQLLALVEADIREELRQFSKEVARFGNHCKDPVFHNLDRYFFRIHYELKPRKTLFEASYSNIEYLMKLVQYTKALYGELRTLDKFELGYIQSERGDIGRPKRELNVLLSSVKNQRNVVKKLKKRSLWTKTMEHIVDKLVDMVHFMHLEINSAFMKNNGDQSVKPASNLHQTLGPAGLALHYANVILQINMLVSASPVVVSDKARDALYQALPCCIRSKLRESLPRHKTMVAEVRAEMSRILQWLVPVAESTRFYYKNGAFGEWEMKGREDVDVDDHEERQIIVSAMLAPGNARVKKIETLYYADKARTEGYILQLVSALHCLVC